MVEGGLGSMKVLVVYAHPNPASFCAALKRTTLELLERAGIETRIHDLYQSRFDPILSGRDFEALSRGQVSEDVAELQADIAWADWLLFIHPTWWMGMPATLKGYFDRVMTYGFAFRLEGGKPVGLLSGKKALIAQTTGSAEADLVGSGMTRAMEQTVAHGLLGYCGVELAAHRFLYAVPSVTADERASMLSAFRDLLVKTLPLPAEVR